MMSGIGKLSVLLVTPDEVKLKKLEAAIEQHVSIPSMIYHAGDMLEAQAKLRNVPAKIIISDSGLAKGSCEQLIEGILADRVLHSSAIIVLALPPEQAIFLDEIVTGQVQFLGDWHDDAALNHCLVKALNFASHGEKSSFYLRFLAAGDQLLKEGEKVDFVYIVKRGQLVAYRLRDGKRCELGPIETGEFVGEMAYINGEHRSANVEAVNDCELIEIPVGTLDKLLFMRPTWSKTLLQTLSKRLKLANEAATSGTK